MRRNIQRGLARGRRRISAVLMAAVLAVAATPFIRGDEARAATTFTVTSTVDASDATPGNGVCETSVAGQCTLRAAIEEANALAGVDTINFNIPGATPLAPATILPSTPLPSIGEAVTIDGYSQPSASANTLAVGNDAGIAIALQGSPVSTGLSVAAGPTVIRGLSVVNFSAQAITVSSGAGVTIAGNFIGLNPNGTFVGNFTGVQLTVGANNVSIGGSTPADRNVISGNTQDGISVAAVTGLAVRGNYIGTSLSGTAALPNVRFGLLLGGSGAQIGGLTAGDRNVISGNGQEGMRVSGSTNTIVGNYIGTTANGLTALGNQDGIFVSNGGIINSAIGNGTVAGRNVISGNRRSGIQHGTLGNRTTIRGNWIGVASDGSSPLGNNTASLGGAGILVTASGLMPLAATIGGNNAGDANIIANTIAGPGVQVTGAQLTGAKIVGNTIFNNSGLGIAFGSGVNPPLVLNDVNDADSGPNNLQNHPVITSAAITGPNLNISYSIDSLPGNSTYPIEIDVYRREGGPILPGSLVASTSIGSPGSAAIPAVVAASIPIVAGESLIATATDANGNTSQFSLPFFVTGGGGGGALIVNSTADGDDVLVGNGVCETSVAGQCTLRAAMREVIAGFAGGTINFNIPGSGVHTITPATPLPILKVPATIDAISGNPGASCAAWPPTLNIELDATSLQFGLEHIGPGGLSLRGMVINRYQQSGVALRVGSGSNTVQCNFIGTNAAASAALPNPGFTADSGILLASSSSNIGGVADNTRNIVAGKQVSQLKITGSDNTVQQNYFGTDLVGANPIPGGSANQRGVLIDGGSNNIIGGTPGLGNENRVYYTAAEGILVTDSLGTAQGNTIRRNSFLGNGGIAVDLATSAGPKGVSFNHVGIAPGPNRFQNFPVLTISTVDGGNARIAGTLDGIAGRTYDIDIYAVSDCHSSGFGPGDAFWTTRSATANGGGLATFDFTLPTIAGLTEPYAVTSTATDTVTKDTSEFSYCRPVATPNLTWVTASPIAGPASQYITDRFQEKWFKFPVSPGAKAKVTLNGQPGSAVTLHRDPNPIYQGLLNPNSAVALSAEAAEPAFLPSGYLPSGYLPSGYLPSGYLPAGFLPSGYLPSGYLPSGYLPSGYLPSGYLPAGSLPSGYLPSGYLPSGYLPAGSLPSGYLPSGYLPSGYLPSGYLPSGFLTTPASIDAYGNAARRSVLAGSADPTARVQTIERNTFDLQEDLYVRVVGPYDLGNPFQLTVSVTGGVCSALTSIGGPLPAPTGASKQTVIITDSSRLHGTAAEKSAAQASLTALAARADVDGVVVDLASASLVRVAAARLQATNNPACPSAGNQLAAEIKNVINSYRSPSLKYVVLAGGADVIPFYQSQDNAGLANERDYVPPVAPNSPSEAALKSGLVSGQDYYGSSVDLNVGGRTIAVPGLAVGRLVDSAGDVTAAVNTYIANGGVIRPGSSLVTGYDFVGDAAVSVASELAAGTNATPDTLIQPPAEPPTGPNAWTATQLKAKLLGSTRHDVVLLTGHFSAGNLLAADYKTQVAATEIQGSNANLANALVIALGCHGGYTIPSTDLLNGSSPDPDWAKAFLRKGAAGYVSATGYAYGDTILTEYGERLVIGLAQQLRTGSGPIPIGAALVAAKQNYLATTAEIAGIDEKTIVAMTLFGLPMMKVDMPGARLPGTTPASIITSTMPVASSPGIALGLTTATRNVGATLTLVNKVLPNLSGGANVTTSYLTGRDGVIARPFEPLLPKEVNNVSVGGKVLRGVALRGATYTDQTGITPLTSAASTETTAPNTAFSSDVFYPTQPWSANYVDAVGGGPTRLLTIPAQYKSAGPGSLVGTLRSYPNLELAFYYLPSTWTAADLRAAAVSPAPNISGVSATSAGTNVTFRVNAQTDGSAGVHAVWVVYTGVPGSPLHGTWAPLDLVRDPTDPTRWTATTAIAGNVGDMRFAVHAVGGAGLVSMATNLGSYYSAVSSVSPPPPPVASSLILDSAPGAVEFLRPATFSATLSSGATALAGRAITFDIGGQAIQAVTSSAGVASVTVTPTATPGALAVSASYRGETLFSSSSASRSVVVNKGATTLAVGPPSSSVNVGQQTAVVASLKDSAGRGLGQKSVIFVFRNGSAVVGQKSVITDNWGDAPLGVVDLPGGSYAVEASFALSVVLAGGQTLTTIDLNYLGSSNTSASLMVASAAPPTIAATATNADASPYVAGTWTKQNVIVTFTCSSGTGLPACTPPQTITAEGTTASVAGTATAANGLTATASFGPIQIDRTGPVIAVTAPSTGSTYAVGSSVLAAYTCNDAGSGGGNCVGTVAAGQPIDTAAAGTKSFTVNSTDALGNTSTTAVSYTVGAVSGGAPVVRADMGVAGLQEIGFPTTIVAVTGSFTDADGSAPYKASVRWAAGRPFTNLVLNNNRDFLAANVFSSSGAYTVTVRICDAANNCGTDDVTVRTNIGLPVTPVRECVIDRGASANPRFQARFGYNNAAAYPVYILSIPLLDNTFTSSPYFRGQPQVFLPGNQRNVFTTNVNAVSISWRLRNVTVTANAASPICP